MFCHCNAVAADIEHSKWTACFPVTPQHPFGRYLNYVAGTLGWDNHLFILFVDGQHPSITQKIAGMSEHLSYTMHWYSSDCTFFWLYREQWLFRRLSLKWLCNSVAWQNTCWLSQCRQSSALVSLFTNCPQCGIAGIHLQIQSLLPQLHQWLASVHIQHSLRFVHKLR